MKKRKFDLEQILMQRSRIVTVKIFIFFIFNASGSKTSNIFSMSNNILLFD